MGITFRYLNKRLKVQKGDVRNGKTTSVIFNRWNFGRQRSLVSDLISVINRDLLAMVRKGFQLLPGISSELEGPMQIIDKRNEQKK